MSARKYPLFSCPDRFLRDGLFFCALCLPLQLISGASNYAADELLIRFKSSLDSDSLQAVEGAHGMTAKKRLRSRVSTSHSRSLSGADSSLILFDTAGQSLEELKAVLEQDSSVDSVSLNYLRYPSSLPDDTDFDLLWALNNTGQSVNGTSGTEDADSLGNWRETENLSDLSADGTADSDGDGFTDAEEFLSLTDPSSASDFLSLENTDYDSESGATLSFQSAAGRNYQVYWTDSLDDDSWEAMDATIEGDGSVVEIEDSSATDADKRFYRLEVYE
jgi:hypothetical protein